MELRKNPDASRYELLIDGELVGKIDYFDAGEAVDIPHTNVDPAHGGQGYAAKLTAFALDDIRAQGKFVIPTCPYTAQYIDKHPQYADLLRG